MPRLDTLTLKQLRAFAAVCETRSISRAAEQLSLTPPAVHTQLKALETNMNSRLLDRTRTNDIVPTEAGRALLLAHTKIAAALDHAAQDVQAADEGLRGFVRLGVVSTAKYFAPKLLARLEVALPDVRIDMSVGNRQQTIEALATGQLDLAIMGRPPRLPNVRDTRLGPNPHILVCAPHHRLASGNVHARDILAERLILREPGSGTRILAERFLDRIGDGSTYTSLVMDSNETIKQAVMAGLGIAILSAHTVLDELQDRRLIAVRHDILPIQRTWYLVQVDGLGASAAAENVRQMIVASAEGLLASQALTSDSQTKT